MQHLTFKDIQRRESKKLQKDSNFKVFWICYFIFVYTINLVV